MQASQTPTLVPLAFAANGTKNAIPEASQISITPGAASLNDGFPPLTFTPVAAGGVPPFGADFNGVLNLITASIRWAHGGGRYAFSSAFVADANVGGYPQGAVLMSADLQGSWLSLNDSNSDNPDTGAGTKWVPQHAYGATAITGLTNANVTLTPAQAMKKRITLAGTLTANVQIIFPAWVGEWIVVNNTTGAFSVTAKTSAGTGVVLAAGQQKVTGDGTNITQPAESIATATSGQQAATLAQAQLLRGGVQNVTGASSATTLTPAQIAGSPIVFFGSSVATLTLPTRAAAMTYVGGGLTSTAIINLGSAPVTVATASGDTFFSPLNSTGTSVTLQPGDDIELVTNGSGNVWTMTGGSALRQYQPLTAAGLTGAGAVGTVGSVRNLMMNVATASASATLTADEIIVESALGGTAYKLASFSKTINLATTGAGGMDTGSPPTTNPVAIYAIYNPMTGASALLATNATSAAAPNVYGGANMPSGYTASALVSVWETNGSGQLVAGIQVDRDVWVNTINQVITSASSLTNAALSLGLPKNAKTAKLMVTFSCTAATNANVAIGSTSSGQTPTYSFPVSGQTGSMQIEVPLITPQNIWYSISNTAGTPTTIIALAGYRI